MAKRTATKQLTDRNWDEEDEPEEAGKFSFATEDVLKGRQIKKAKRRGITGGEGGPSVFAGFGGFKGTGPTAPAFSLSTNTNGSNSLSKEETKLDTEKPFNKTKEDSDYLVNLKSLNESVATWINQHVDKNPFCILTPIFKDYEKHLAELEKDKKQPGKKNGDSTEKNESIKAQGLSVFNFNGTANSAKSGFTFESKTSPTTFGKPAENRLFGGFNFGTSTIMTNSESVPSGFTFGSSAPTKTEPDANTGKSAGGDDDEYVPPVVEIDVVKEEGAFYTKRCKLFYQKEGKWVERGVGNLHLKMSGEKLQLVIRADTSLGNIMLNIILSEGIPVKKQGKNNVFFVCVPNPPFDPKADAKTPVPVLLRVKTSEDAEELVAKIDEKRK